MQAFMAVLFTVLLLIAAIITSVWRRREFKKIAEEFKEKENSYTLIIGAYDWGPAVNKAILNIGPAARDFTAEDLDSREFSVRVKSECYSAENVLEAKDFTRPVTRAYFCDIDGSELDGDFCRDEANEVTHLALEFEVHPDSIEGSPFTYSSESGHNQWKKTYEYSFAHRKLSSPITECNDWFCPESQEFREFSTGTELTASYFIPQTANSESSLPLIIWLNGAGEGGSDYNIELLGNKTTALAQEKIQSHFRDGAAVLCIQTPTFWMQNGDIPYDIIKEECTDKKSRYTEACIKTILNFLKKFPCIDADRVYAGGCSNGGYMAVNLLLARPELFAAAYPICEAYKDSWLSEKDIDVLKKIPLWFTAAVNDGTVNPQEHTIATVKRLEAENAPVMLSLFDDVHDTSGKYPGADSKPYQYYGHWSWIYAFNDECSCGSEKSLWSWLSRQNRTERI